MFTMVGNVEDQAPMARYMRNQFKFLGLKTPQRKAASKAFIKASKAIPVAEMMAKIADLYTREEREYQYVAIDVAYANVKRLSFADIQALTKYIQIKSWWDTVDTCEKSLVPLLFFIQKKSTSYLTCSINMIISGCDGLRSSYNC